MATTISKLALRAASSALPDRFHDSLVRLFSRPLAEQLYGKITGDFLQLLLGGMELACCASKDYRRNIENLQATYSFRTKDGRVGCSAVFHDGDMRVESTAKSPYDALISFKDAQALWRFLLSGNQDVLNSILANEVDIDGNLNYIYKFAFMAADLERRLGVA
jgi:hypothetical protein